MSNTHNLVVGDVDKYIDLLKTKHNIFGKTIGQKPVVKKLPVDIIEEAESQRNTVASWAYNCIVSEGGINESVNDNINVIETKDGRFICFDGLGRLAIHQMMGRKTIACNVLQGDEKMAAGLFSKKNKRLIRSVNPEAIFSAEVVEGTASALNELKAMKTVGLTVRVRHDKTLPANSLDPQIKISGFRKAMKHAEGVKDEDDKDVQLDVLKMARDLIVNAYTEDKVVRADLFVGLVILLITFRDLQRPGAPFDQLEKYLAQMGATMEQVKLPFKKDGGNQHNAEFESVAYGLLRNFTASKICTGSTRDRIPHKVLRSKYNLAEIRN